MKELARELSAEQIVIQEFNRDKKKTERLIKIRVAGLLGSIGSITNEYKFKR